jgi:hypothetical protein
MKVPHQLSLLQNSRTGMLGSFKIEPRTVIVGGCPPLVWDLPCPGFLPQRPNTFAQTNPPTSLFEAKTGWTQTKDQQKGKGMPIRPRGGSWQVDLRLADGTRLRRTIHLLRPCHFLGPRGRCCEGSFSDSDWKEGGLPLSLTSALAAGWRHTSSEITAGAALREAFLRNLMELCSCSIAEAIHLRDRISHIIPVGS